MINTYVDSANWQPTIEVESAESEDEIKEPYEDTIEYEYDYDDRYTDYDDTEDGRISGNLLFYYLCKDFVLISSKSQNFTTTQDCERSWFF